MAALFIFEGLGSSCHRGVMAQQPGMAPCLQAQGQHPGSLPEGLNLRLTLQFGSKPIHFSVAFHRGEAQLGIF